MVSIWRKKKQQKSRKHAYCNKKGNTHVWHINQSVNKQKSFFELENGGVCLCVCQYKNIFIDFTFKQKEIPKTNSYDATCKKREKERRRIHMLGIKFIIKKLPWQKKERENICVSVWLLLKGRFRLKNRERYRIKKEEERNVLAKATENIRFINEKKKSCLKSWRVTVNDLFYVIKNGIIGWEKISSK